MRVRVSERASAFESSKSSQPAGVRAHCLASAHLNHQIIAHLGDNKCTSAYVIFASWQCLEGNNNNSNSLSSERARIH